MACSCSRPEAPTVGHPASEPAAPSAQPPTPAQPPADPEPSIEEQARAQVKQFLHDVRIEKYQEAYDACSDILKNAYSYDQFLMVAGKLQMEQMPCIADSDIDAMTPTSGPVGLGAKDVEVAGFSIAYRCEADDEDRVLTLYLDWDPQRITAPSGVASLFFP